MRRDILLLAEMIEAAEQAIALVAGQSLVDIEQDRRRRDALMWNPTVLGEAASQVSVDLRDRFDDIPWREPTGCVTG